MTDKEAYIAEQEASGIEVGDTVRVMRKARSDERGWKNCWTGDMAFGVERTVRSNCGANGLTLDDESRHNYPYFVLEIVKKKDGSVPNKVKVKEPCVGCKHLDTDVCVDCNVYGDGSCTCHTGNPPCSYCTDSLWEEEINNPLGEPSMSTTNFECKAVLVEDAGDGTVTKSVVVFKNDLFEVDETEAKRRFSMDLVYEIKEAEKKGKVEILCRPFCQR